jgi:hypothetical protein
LSTYSLRLPDALMREAKDAAKRNHTSLNQLFVSAIAERVGADRTERMFAAMAERADFAAFQRILDRVPDTQPELGDELES